MTGIDDSITISIHSTTKRGLMAKISVSFRFDEDIVNLLERQSVRENRNRTQHLQELIKKEENRRDDRR